MLCTYVYVCMYISTWSNEFYDSRTFEVDKISCSIEINCTASNETKFHRVTILFLLLDFIWQKPFTKTKKKENMQINFPKAKKKEITNNVNKLLQQLQAAAN